MEQILEQVRTHKVVISSTHILMSISSRLSDITYRVMRFTRHRQPMRTMKRILKVKVIVQTITMDTGVGRVRICL